MEVFAPEADKLAVTTEFAKVVFSILESSYVTPNIFCVGFCGLRHILRKNNLVFGVNELAWREWCGVVSVWCTFCCSISNSVTSVY